jgi:copper(I)-binding protein
MRSPLALTLAIPCLFAATTMTLTHAYARCVNIPTEHSTGFAPGIYAVAWHMNPVGTGQANADRLTVADAGETNLHFDHIWARPSVGVAKTGAVYFTISVISQPDRLVGASSPDAVSAELHETINDNGVMKMRRATGIDLVPGKPVTLRPGGYHLMLLGLNAPLKVGESFPLTLNFQHGQPVTVTVKVETSGGGGMANMPNMHGH